MKPDDIANAITQALVQGGAQWLISTWEGIHEQLESNIGAVDYVDLPGRGRTRSRLVIRAHPGFDEPHHGTAVVERDIAANA
jgi:hypothetical protein